MASQNKCPRDIKIRKMIMEDIPAVIEIDRVTDADPWTESIFRRELQLPVSHTLVATHQQGSEVRIAGFITFWIVADELQLHKIAVIRQVQRCGIGKRLFQAMTALALAHGVFRATLEVRCTNDAAISLYETFGYQVSAVRKGYYGATGEDALMMSVNLRPDSYLKH